MIKKLSDMAKAIISENENTNRPKLGDYVYFGIKHGVPSWSTQGIKSYHGGDGQGRVIGLNPRLRIIKVENEDDELDYSDETNILTLSKEEESKLVQEPTRKHMWYMLETDENDNFDSKDLNKGDEVEVTHPLNAVKYGTDADSTVDVIVPVGTVGTVRYSLNDPEGIAYAVHFKNRIKYHGVVSNLRFKKK
tara:strand:- start:322 stop:897 length:576 start_codon:yes stop_codon:yes gene_type:complete